MEQWATQSWEKETAGPRSLQVAFLNEGERQSLSSPLPQKVGLTVTLEKLVYLTSHRTIKLAFIGKLVQPTSEELPQVGKIITI